MREDESLSVLFVVGCPRCFAIDLCDVRSCASQNESLLFSRKDVLVFVVVE